MSTDVVGVIDAQVTTDLAPLPPAFLTARPPAEVLAVAVAAAQALQDVVAKKENPVIMNGQQYLEFEDWQTVGRFYDVTCREDGDPEFVQFDLGSKLVSGFKASAVALRRGEVISRATAFCMDDEEKWSERSKFAWCYVTRSGEVVQEDPGPDNIVWEPTGQFKPDGSPKFRPKKVREQVGVERVPLFQMASMAQTRANAKVLRNVLAWVVVLAGYRPTPAEEIDNLRGGGGQDDGGGQQPPERHYAPPAATAPAAAPAKPAAPPAQAPAPAKPAASAPAGQPQRQGGQPAAPSARPPAGDWRQPGEAGQHGGSEEPKTAVGLDSEILAAATLLSQRPQHAGQQVGVIIARASAFFGDKHPNSGAEMSDSMRWDSKTPFEKNVVNVNNPARAKSTTWKQGILRRLNDRIAVTEPGAEGADTLFADSTEGGQGQ